MSVRARAALSLALLAVGGTARAEDAPVALSLEPGACATSIDAVVLAGHVALEAPVDVVPSADARERATWAEPPCDPKSVRVVLRDAAGTAIAGPVMLSTEGLSPRLQARVVALWVGEAVRTLAASARRDIAPTPATRLEAPRPVTTTPRPRAVPPAPTPPPAKPQPTPRARVRVALIGGFGYAPSTTSSVVSGMVAVDLAPLRRRTFLLQLDVGASAVWTPFDVDLGLFTAGLALLLPFDLHPNLSLEIGLRATLSHVALLRAAAGIDATGDQLLSGGGGIVRAVVHDGAFGSMVEVELGGPFGGYSVRAASAPASNTVVFDGMRVDVRVGVSFE